LAVPPTATKLRHYSFGSTAAIVTSVGLIVGAGAVTISRATIVSALLIVAVADNISDSLSIHVYQESENLEGRGAFRATVANFVSRLFVALSFVSIVLFLPMGTATIIAVAWGVLLLGALSFLLARARSVSPVREILKHIGVAVAVVAVSRALGSWISANVH
jgi:VIT1/CCC1 family predicted Fe2+/Mn2+ transporter